MVIAEQFSRFTPYRRAVSAPLALCLRDEPKFCRRLGLMGTALPVLEQSWLEEQLPLEAERGSEFSASNSWLSCRASKGLAGAGAAGTAVVGDREQFQSTDGRGGHDERL